MSTPRNPPTPALRFSLAAGLLLFLPLAAAGVSAEVNPPIPPPPFPDGVPARPSLTACIGIGLTDDYVTSWGPIKGLTSTRGIWDRSGFRAHTAGDFAEAAYFDYITDQNGWYYYRLTGYTSDPALTCGWNLCTVIKCPEAVRDG